MCFGCCFENICKDGIRFGLLFVFFIGDLVIPFIISISDFVWGHEKYGEKLLRIIFGKKKPNFKNFTS